MIFALDLEGVLAPEIWPILGERFELHCGDPTSLYRANCQPP